MICLSLSLKQCNFLDLLCVEIAEWKEAIQSKNGQKLFSRELIAPSESFSIFSQSMGVKVSIDQFYKVIDYWRIADG